VDEGLQEALLERVFCILSIPRNAIKGYVCPLRKAGRLPIFAAATNSSSLSG
jgi:hypothetical protein